MTLRICAFAKLIKEDARSNGNVERICRFANRNRHTFVAFKNTYPFVDFPLRCRALSMPLSRMKALALLGQCQGDEIWSVAVCRQAGVPSDWIEELAEAFESGFRSDSQTIYYEGQVVNQYHGISDRDLAYKLAEFLGVDTAGATVGALGRVAEVTALKEAVDE